MRKCTTIVSLIVVFQLLFIGAAWTQSRGITGTVSDNSGHPLLGATVAIENTNVAVTTDDQGRFALSVPSGAKNLTVTFVGMKTFETELGTQTTFDIHLVPEEGSLNEVVVIGYGTQQRKDVNGAISSVTSKEIAEIPQATVDQMLQGKVSGVTITNNSGQPGAGISVRVRGITSFSSSEPLYVIDGVAIDGNAPGQLNTNDLGISPSEQEHTPSVLSSINPNDIESIDVLKDASATAIYGSRGANGVVIITTKRGSMGEGKLSYDGYYGWQEQAKFLKMMNLQEYAEFENKLSNEFGGTPRIEFADPSKLGTGTDWQKAVFRRAGQMNHNLSFSGGKNGTDYYFSGGYFDQDGTVIGSDYNRYSFHSTVNSQAKSWLKVGSSISANRNHTNVGLGNTYGTIYSALLQAPDVAVYNADGTFSGPVRDASGNIQGGQNPLQRVSTITNFLTRSNLQGRIYFDVTFAKDFTIHSEVNGNFNWGQAKIFEPTYSYGAAGQTPAYQNTQAQLRENNNFDTYWSWLEHLNYSHTFGKHSVQALVGREVWESAYGGIVATIKDFTAGNTIQTLNLGNQETATLDEPKGSTSMESYLARAIYTFDNKYSITANIRRDRSSNFAEGHQVGYFPGVAVSWRLTEEAFMEGISKIFNDLRIRAGYGTTGNSNIPQYSYGSAIGPVTTGVGTGFKVNNFANPDLTWETAIQTNIGLDFSLLGSRIEGSFDYYKKTSKNFLFQQPLPSFLSGGVAEFSGVAVVNPPWVNAGKIENKGIDLSITSRNIVTKEFTWSTGIILSHYKNKVVSLNGFPDLDGIISTGFGPTIFATLTQVGGSIGEFYGYKVEGIISTQEQLEYLAQHPQNVIGQPQTVTSDRSVANGIWLGDIMYAGNDGKGGPNQQYVLGSPNPDFTYSITNTFTYKDFDLSIFLNGSYGGKILNALSFQTIGMYGLYMNQRKEASNFWTENNPNTNVPAPRASFGNNNLVMSDRFLENASYLRIQNVRLGYTLPARWAGKIAMSSLKVYFSGQNLHVFSKYSGLDPEIGSMNQNPILQNIDYGRYPMPRVLTVGLNATF